MANVYGAPDAPQDAPAAPGSDQAGGGGGAPGAPPGGGPPGGPPGGGPVLAALQRRTMGPQVSAPGPGNQADSLMMLKSAIDMITQALGGLPAGTPPHRDALNALRQLSRHIAQGGPTAGVQATQLQDLLRNTMRNALLQRIMASQEGGGQGGGGGAEGGPPPAPMPATPLPGA